MTPATLRNAIGSCDLGWRHVDIAAAVILGVVTTALPAWMEPGLLAAAVVVGLPHGGLDHVVARGRFASRYGGWWWLPFLAGYLGLAAAVLLAWSVVPAAMLGGFLLLSIPHFGSEDGAAAGDVSLAAILAHGGVPVVVPALVHPDAVGMLFSSLVGGGGAQVLRLAAGPVAAVWALAAGVLVHRHVRSPDRSRDASIELAGTILLFAVATPLAAFSIYFAVVHTPRAFGSLRRSLPQRERHRLVARSLPLAMVGVLAGGGLFVLAPAGSIRDDTVRAAFALLSALTVPHMWLAWLSRSTGIADRPARLRPAVAGRHRNSRPSS